MEKYRNLIMDSPLSAGLDERDWEYVKLFYRLEEVHYAKNEFLNVMYAPLPHFGLVASGTVQVCRDDFYGRKMIMANMTEGNFFGESLCLTQDIANVYIIAVTDCRVIWFRPDGFRVPDDPSDSRAFIMMRNLTLLLARRALKLNDRIQALSKPSLREKLIAFFSEYTRDGSREFTIPFDRESMAVYLGVNRSALSRELSNMKRDGLISYQKNKFTITPAIDN